MGAGERPAHPVRVRLQDVLRHRRERDHQAVGLQQLLEANHTARVKVIGCLLLLLLALMSGDVGAAAVAAEEVGEKGIKNPRPAQLLLAGRGKGAETVGERGNQADDQNQLKES